jgi:hypothetical protein
MRNNASVTSRDVIPDVTASRSIKLPASTDTDDDEEL